MSCLLLSACSGGSLSIENRPDFKSDVLQFTTPADDAPVAIFHTNLGSIMAVLYPEEAPLAVENFIYLAEKNYYDGLEIYRIVPEFVVQTGSPSNNGTGGETKWGKPFANKFTENLHHYSGALAMANWDTVSTKGTNTSIFYFVQTPQNSVDSKTKKQMLEAGFSQNVVDAYSKVGGAPYLDNNNTVFGQIFHGMDILDTIALQDIDEASKPIIPIVLDSVVISSYGEQKAVLLPPAEE